MDFKVRIRFNGPRAAYMMLGAFFASITLFFEDAFIHTPIAGAIMWLIYISGVWAFGYLAGEAQ